MLTNAQTCMNKKEEYAAFVKEYLFDYNPDACLWCLGYALYTHSIDDIQDNEIPKDLPTKFFILDTFEMAESIYTNIFYLQNIATLRPLIHMTANCYRDSVALEGKTKEWEKYVSDHLRSVGNEILLAVIEIVRGIEVKREASLRLRELSYCHHHDSVGNPI